MELSKILQVSAVKVLSGSTSKKRLFQELADQVAQLQPWGSGPVQLLQGYPAASRALSSHATHGQPMATHASLRSQATSTRRTT